MTRRGEFELIADLFAPLATSPGALGLRDDAAVVSVSVDHELVVTTDTVIAGVHFLHDESPDLVARKALRVNLSDLAAKGAKPIGILHALTLNAAADDTYLAGYAQGLGEDLRTFGVPLLGGDTTAHRANDGPLTITITALGEVPRGTALLRSGASAGDLLCVSGTIGDAAAGLRVLEGRQPPLAAEHRDALLARYRLPQPRLALGHALRGLASASTDISDGFCADVGHLCAASGLAVTVEWGAIPRSSALDRALMDDPGLRLTVLGGGDDYEIAFTVPRDRRDELDALAASTQTRITVIGHMFTPSVGAAKGVTVIGDNGQAIDVPHPGFTHGRG